MKEGLLALPSMGPGGCRVQIFQDKDLSEFSLLSIGQFCDAGCTAHYDKTTVWITDDKGITIITGVRDQHTGLYMVNLHDLNPCTAPQAMAAPVVPSDPVAQRVAYWAASMGAPVTDTLLRAMRKGFVEFPGITARDVARHPPDFTATPKGHMKMRRQGLQPTQYDTPDIVKPEDEDFPNALPSKGPGQPVPTSIASTVCTKCIPMTEQHFSDMAGRFPLASFTGAEYMLIMFCTDANYIHCETMTSRSGKEYARAYQQGITFFMERGITPRWERLDNETSRDLTGVARKLGITIQYLPPHNHRASKAERAIQTWKGHFISVLCMTHPDFPMGAWDHLVDAAELTLNLLRGSRANPTISAWAHLHGPINLTQTPIAPAGMKVVIFESTQQRASWAPHGVDGFYVGPALQHYRCHRVFVPKTKRTRIAETLSWHPHNVRMPASSADDLLHAAVLDLRKALQDYSKSPQSTTATRQPLPAIRTAITTALTDMAALFGGPASVAAVQAPAERPSIPTPLVPSELTLAPGAHVPAPDLEDGTATQESGIQSPTTTVSPVHSATPLEAPVPVAPPKAPPAAPRRSRRPRHRNPKYASASIALRDYACTAMDMDAEGGKLRYETALAGSEGAQWEAGSNKEFDRLVLETHTGTWIHIRDVPKDRVISYYNPQLTRKRRPEETCPGGIEYRVRGTYGGNRGDYKGPTAAETADITTVKLVLNSVASDPEAQWLTTDISDFYLGTPMDTPEYMRVPLKYIPAATMEKHNLAGLVHNGAVIMQLNKGIYGLKQAGRLAQQRLIKHLADHGYHQTEHTPCLFKHDTNSVIFTLVVDDFGVKYKQKEDVTHLLDTLEKLYKIKTNWSGDAYIGFDIAIGVCPRLNIKRVTLSMPRFLPNALKRFNIKPGKPVYNPIDYRPGIHTAIQRPTPEDSSAPATKAETLRIQQIVGVILYYARAIDSTFTTPVGKVSSAQATPTAAVLTAAERLLHYAATQPAAALVFYGSKMDMIVHGDASYLSETKARSRVAGVYYLGDKDHPDTLNAPFLCTSAILDVVVTAATEAEYGAAYTNAKQIATLRGILHDLGHPQAPTLMVIDNKAAEGIANDTVTQRHSKAMDMRFHFVRDRVRQGQIRVVWQPGRRNLADYFTKAHPTKHYMAMRQFFVSTPPLPDDWTLVGRHAAPAQLTRRLTLADLPDPRPPSHRPTIVQLVEKNKDKKRGGGEWTDTLS